MILTVYVLCLLALAIHAPPFASGSHAPAFVAILGVLTAWQAGWGLVHLVRALVFRRRHFPPLRRAADALDRSAARPPHLYVVITSFGVRAETRARVLQAAVDEAVRFKGRVTLVACLLEAADQRLIKQTFHGLTPPDDVRLILVRRPAIGRRHALAAGLRAVARARPAYDAAVVLMTGDTLLPKATFERSVPFLKLMPEVDLILTDETGIGGGGTFDAWLALRRAERHQMMSSMALGPTLDVLDGGVAIFRAGLVTRRR